MCRFCKSPHYDESFNFRTYGAHKITKNKPNKKLYGNNDCSTVDDSWASRRVAAAIVAAGWCNHFRVRYPFTYGTLDQRGSLSTMYPDNYRCKGQLIFSHYFIGKTALTIQLPNVLQHQNR